MLYRILQPLSVIVQPDATQYTGVGGIFQQDLFAGALPDLLEALALFDRMYSFTNGIFDLTAVVYYLTVAALFVYLTVQSMDKKRWS